MQPGGEDTVRSSASHLKHRARCASTGAAVAVVTVATLVLALLVGTPAVAWAYVDPGYGTLIWQALVSGALGGVFLARQSIAAVWRRFRGRQHEGAPPDDPPAA